jgi:hypothetical protein
MSDHASSLIDRYIYAVRRLLPRAQRDDIASELREILQSQVDDEVSLRQHPLSEEEVGDILKKYGQPCDVAARYGSRQYLIGPEIFPYYLVAVRIALWVMLPVAVVMLLITILTARERVIGQVAETLWSILSIGLVNLAIVTLTFAFQSRVSPRRNDVEDWDPAELPELVPDPEQPIRRSDVFGSLVGISLRLYVDAGAMLNLLAFFVLVSLLRAGHYVAARDGAAGGVDWLTFMFDKFIFAVLIVVTILVAISAVNGIVRLFRSSRFALGEHI